MPANIDTMIYVGEVPWHGLGTDLTSNPPKTGAEIIAQAGMDWTVAAAPMHTDFHDRVFNYHTIYREDTGDPLGVVNVNNPRLVQNSETFNAFDNLIGTAINTETAASLGRGETIFGCFKINAEYSVLDDAVQHYFVVMNDHLKTDGKVLVLNTPIRVVCQNTLSAALHNSFYKFRIPITADASANKSLAGNLIRGVDDAINNLKKRASDLVGKKITKEYVEHVLDELFPYVEVSQDAMEGSNNVRANERISMIRNTFLQDCMGADNLANYRGTQWQMFNALTDFTQHFHKNLDKAYDLNYRMKLLPGVGVDSPSAMVSKYLSIADKIAA